jgi:hypothetical protein
LTWIPSDKDRLSNPDLPLDASIEVVLHEAILANGKALRMVSSLPAHAIPAAELYSHRYDVEFDIRDVKVTMDTENVRGKSVEMGANSLVKLAEPILESSSSSIVRQQLLRRSFLFAPVGDEEEEAWHQVELSRNWIRLINND